MKIFLYDLETTGVNHWRHGIHQISGMIILENEIKETFNFKVQPNPNAKIEKEALEIGNVTLEQIMSYPSMNVVYRQINDMLSKYVNKFNKHDKFHLMGYNINSFDNHFFRAFFVQNNDNYFGSWFWSDSIDVMVLATNKLKGERHKMENFKQSTVAKYMGIEVEDDKLHDAMYDVELCYKIYQSI